MHNQNLNKEDFIFQFKDIQNYIENLEKNVNDKTSINKNKDNITIKELTIFKEFAQKYLFQFNVGKEAKEIDFNNWWFCSGITLKNLTLNKDKKSKQNKPLIFKLKDINTDSLKDCKDENLKKEINKFKDFATKYLLNSSKNEKEFDNWTFSPQPLKINDLNNDLYDEDEIDILFINKDKFNHSYFFLVEIKDFSDSELIISKYWDYRNALVKIKRKDLNLESYIFSLLNKNCTFIRINIFKWDKQTFKQQYYKFEHEKSGDLFDYPTNNWIKIEEQEIKNIFQSSYNICLKDNNIHDYIRQFHSEDYLDELLNNWKDKNYISNVLVSNVNFKSLNHISNNKDNRITIINGIPGSGKTVFAFLLFITEKNVLLILTNRANYEKYRNNEYIKKIEEVNNNKIIFYTSKRFPWAKDYDCDFDQIQRNIEKYQVILIDEFQNIENSLLKNIANCCFNVNKEDKVFLFGDEKQNIYGKLNFENNESNHDKYNHLIEILKAIIIEKFNLAKKIKKELLKYIYESDDFKISNRFNLKDFNKINYICFGKENYKNEYTQNSEKSYIKIKCLLWSNIQDSISNNSSEFKVIDIRSNNKNEVFTQYKAAGNEYENIVININSCFILENEKLIYRYQKRNNNEKVDIDSDITSVWLYSACTRATKQIIFLIDKNNKYAKEIYKYFNDKIDELENNDTKN